jgi:hypothetical protein
MCRGAVIGQSMRERSHRFGMTEVLQRLATLTCKIGARCRCLGRTPLPGRSGNLDPPLPTTQQLRLRNPQWYPSSTSNTHVRGRRHPNITARLSLTEQGCHQPRSSVTTLRWVSQVRLVALLSGWRLVAELRMGGLRISTCSQVDAIDVSWSVCCIRLPSSLPLCPVPC